MKTKHYNKRRAKRSQNHYEFERKANEVKRKYHRTNGETY